MYQAYFYVQPTASSTNNLTGLASYQSLDHVMEVIWTHCQEERGLYEGILKALVQ